MIYASEELLRINQEQLNDPVLHWLLSMGVWDWSKEEGEELHQATQVIRFSTALAS